HIMYVNAKGYFDAIYDNPTRYFSSLANFSELVVPTDDQSLKPVPHTSEPIKRFIGDVEMSGKFSINGSSFSLTDGLVKLRDLKVGTISILDKNGNMKTYGHNQDIIDLEVIGQYEVIINSSGSLNLPQTLSDNDYLQLSLPSDFDITLRTSDNNEKYSRIKILISNSSSEETLMVDSKSTILLNKVAVEPPLKSVPIVIKNPVIKLEGNLKFEKTNFYGELNYPPLEVSGNSTVTFNFMDDFNEHYRKGTKTQRIGYLESIDSDGKRKRNMQELKLPGDISPDVRKRGLDVPLQSIIFNSTNIVLILATIMGTAFTTWLIRKTHFL
ncbi:MAG TPA: hypothetical protein VJS91_06825, partial [Nitrososphaeraceae archaeon]|nr:hypothetical protein [Nitrososphaeraceae archaeon]